MNRSDPTMISCGLYVTHNKHGSPSTLLHSLLNPLCSDFQLHSPPRMAARLSPSTAARRCFPASSAAANAATQTHWHRVSTTSDCTSRTVLPRKAPQHTAHSSCGALETWKWSSGKNWRHSRPGWMWLWAAWSAGWRPCT